MLVKSRLVLLIIHLFLVFNLGSQSLEYKKSTEVENEKTNSYKIDLRIDPVLLAFNDLDIAIEFFLKKDLSFEIMLTYITKRMEEFDPFSNSLTFHTDGFGFEVYLKNYLMNNHCFDGLFFSPYIRYRNISGPTKNNSFRMQNKRFAIGISAGIKHMFTERLSLELMIGLGYAVSNKFEYTPALNQELNYLFTDIDLIIRVPLAYRF